MPSLTIVSKYFMELFHFYNLLQTLLLIVKFFGSGNSGLLYVAKEVNDILGDISLFYIIILQIYLQTQSKVTLTLDYKLYNIR